jgi:hypothetical protein
MEWIIPALLAVIAVLATITVIASAIGALLSARERRK